MGKNKRAKWDELATFNNVFQPEPGNTSYKDHQVKGCWNKDIFRNNNPVILELGCGKGEYTTSLAERFPDKNFIGVDVKGARMWRGAKTANEQNLSNVAFLRTRIEFIGTFFARDEVEEIWLPFPDPHPGWSNVNKRLTSPHFLNIYRHFTRQHGLIHLKTDNEELFNYTNRVANANSLEILFSSTDIYSETHISEMLLIKTHYEKIFLETGSKINYLAFRINIEKCINDPTLSPYRKERFL